jgi:hypothetical protein
MVLWLPLLLVRSAHFNLSCRAIHLLPQARRFVVVLAFQSVLNLFCIKYTTAAAKKRRYLLYMAVELLTEPVNAATEIVADKTILGSVVSQIDNVYKQIKKNEQGTKTDYLMGSDKEENFRKTVQRLEMMREMDIV